MTDREPSEETGHNSAPGGFVGWYRQRPFVGALLVAVAGVEIFFSGQLDIGKIHVQVGIEGLQATILPIILVLVGVLAMFMPAHRIFYGVIALVVSVYSLVGVNLGGFFVGMLLGLVGGVMVVSWLPKKRPDATEIAQDTAEDPDAPTPNVEVDVGAAVAPRATGRRRRASRTGALVIGAVLASGCLAGLELQGAPPADALEPSVAPAGLCILGFIDCGPTPTPSPSAPAIPGAPTPGAPGTSGGTPGAGGAAGGSSAPGSAPGSTPKAPAQTPVAARGASVFTQPSADLSGTSISLGGLHYVGLVKVPISGGRTVTALELGADHIAIRDFSLTTTAADGHGVRATAVTMTLDGHVVVYANSVNATLGNGTPVKYDPVAPPTPGELLSSLVTLHLGLVGVTADTVSYAPSEQLIF